MKTLLTETTDSYRDKGSKFIGYLFPAKTKENFGHHLDQVKSQYPDATHHCYAWRLNPANIEEFAQDDGEPSGTAGLPILNQLKSSEVVNVGLVVVRYYGGTKLGKAGLIEAYGHTASLCLEKARMKPIKLIHKIRLRYPYSQQNAIEKLIHQHNLTELKADYLEEVTLTLACPTRHTDALKNKLQHLAHLGIDAEFIGKSFV